MKKMIMVFLIFALAVGLCSTPDTATAAAVRLNKNSVKVTAGKTITLKVKNTKKKAKWTVKSGKKFVRLTSKKKSSVKIQGVKKGTAKVQCRIGKKKLVCKVKVMEGQVEKSVPTATPDAAQEAPVPTGTPASTDSPNPTATATPTVSPTVAPTETPESTVTPCPTHIPTEDCLMAEPQMKLDLPIEDENGFQLWRPWGDTIYYFFGSDILRTDVNLQFTDTNQVPDEAEWWMDVSEKQNGSVMAWYCDVDEDGAKEMMIGQEGGVVANPDSSYLLCDLKSVSGLEYLYTTDVVNMSYMFLRYGGMSGLQKLDLGNHFETSKVENMYHMFEFCGYLHMEDIYLGRMFDVTKVTNSTGMFLDWVTVIHHYYVNSETLKSWLLDEENHTTLTSDIADKIVVLTK